MRRIGRRALFSVLLLSPFFAAAEARAEDSFFVYAFDAFVPGWGSFYTGHEIRGSLIATGRIATIAFAVQAHRYATAYHSAAQAARVAEFLYGPGFRYKNPYGSGYYTAAEFQRRADRYTFYSSLSVTLHAMLTAVSLYVVGTDLREEEAKKAPVFDAAIFPDGPGRTQAAAAFSVRFAF